MGLGDRINQRLKSLGISQSQLARAVGVSQATIAGLVSGRSAGSKHLHEIAKTLRTTPAYLSGEVDNPDEGYIPPPTPALLAEQLDLVQVPEIDLKFGFGATNLEVPVTRVARHFSRAFIRQYTHASPDQLYFAHGTGDSMMPTLLDSDLLLIDASERDLRVADKIWAVAYCGAGMIKRLRPTRDGVRILSDNPNVPDDTAYDGELHILGRVVGIVRKM